MNGEWVPYPVSDSLPVCQPGELPVSLLKQPTHVANDGVSEVLFSNTAMANELIPKPPRDLGFNLYTMS